MTRYYRRIEGGRKSSIQAGLVAGGVATVVGAVSYYLVKLLLAREPLDPIGQARSERGEQAGETDGR